MDLVNETNSRSTIRTGQSVVVTFTTYLDRVQMSLLFAQKTEHGTGEQREIAA
jgi:hypothetical protein